MEYKHLSKMRRISLLKARARVREMLRGKMDFTVDADTDFAERLQYFIKKGYTEHVKGILLDYSLYSIVDKSGATLLHYSAQYNNANLIQYFLDRGLDVDVQDFMGITPLMIAVMEKHISVVRILLAAGADIFKLNNTKKSVLHIVRLEHARNCEIIEAVFRVLLKKCPTSEGIARKLLDAGFHLFHAIVLQDAEVIEYMLKEGSPVNFANPVNKVAAIHEAAILDDLRSMKVLVEHGADVNALDGGGENPLHKLYRNDEQHNSKKIDILKILLNGRASMTSCTANGVLQVYHILAKGNREAVRMLIESGLDFSVKDNQSEKSAIHYCAYNPDPGVTEVLKRHVDKFNVNARDKFGITPLVISAYKGNVSMLKFLLKQGATLDGKYDDFLKNPLYYTYLCAKLGFEQQYRDCGEILLQYGADPQFVALNKKGEKSTIFDAALKTNNIDRIKPVVAHLAMIEKRGTSITETIMKKINSNNSLKKHFRMSQKLLREKISGQVTLYDLLISDKKQMARYLNNKSIARTLNNKSYKFKVSKYKYYHNILYRLCLKGNRYKMLKNEGAKNISRLFQNRIHMTDLIVDKIIDYLNDQSLRELGRLYDQLPSQK